MAYIQRYPFAPKAIWFKRYTDTSNLGRRKIYVATPEIGFEINDNLFFSKVELKNGLVEEEAVEYIDITNSALKLFNKLYTFNPNINTLEEQDFIEDERKIISATPSEVLTIEKNVYIKKYAFDCIKDADQQNSTYQPISGLITNSSYLTIKTHCFSNIKEEPKPEDLIFYQGKNWTIEETSKTYFYTPKERSILHISMKAINK